MRELNLLLVAVLLLDLHLLRGRSLPGRVHDGHPRPGHGAGAVPRGAHGGALGRHAA